MPSLSRGLRAAKALDGFAPLRDGLLKAAIQRGDWAGIPMPLQGERLIVEPSFPKAKELMEIGWAQPAGPDPDEGWTIRNQWHSPRHGANILIIQSPDGKISWGKTPAVHHFTQDLQTLGCSEAWGLEQEHRAMQLLGTMISHRQMKHYVLTGMFLERSRRSGVTYIFRRLRPTVALSASPGFPPDHHRQRILTTLCMHPIGYYGGSWAGAMCPTDDVIAHLTLMRGDERMFWARANHHPPTRPEAGL